MSADLELLMRNLIITDEERVVLNNFAVSVACRVILARANVNFGGETDDTMDIIFKLSMLLKEGTENDELYSQVLEMDELMFGGTTIE